MKKQKNSTTDECWIGLSRSHFNFIMTWGERVFQCVYENGMLCKVYTFRNDAKQMLTRVYHLPLEFNTVCLDVTDKDYVETISVLGTGTTSIIRCVHDHYSEGYSRRLSDEDRFEISLTMGKQILWADDYCIDLIRSGVIPDAIPFHLLGRNPDPNRYSKVIEEINHRLEKIKNHI